MFRYVAAGEDGGLRSRSRTLHWLRCGDGDGDSHLTPNSDLPPQLPSPHPHGSQVPTSKTTAAMPTHPPHLQNIHPPRICPQCNPPGDPAHSPGGVCFASLGEDGRDGTLPDLQTQQLAESDLSGSTRSMGSSRWGCSDVGSAARGRHRSQLLPSPPRPMQSSRSACRLRVSRGAGQPSHAGAGNVDLDLTLSRPYLGRSIQPTRLSIPHRCRQRSPLLPPPRVRVSI